MSIAYVKCPKCDTEHEIELEPSDHGIKNHILDCENCGATMVAVTSWGGPPKTLCVGVPGKEKKT